MATRFEYWIGSRYVRSRSSNSFVSLISAISMLGIAIAVMVLIVVMSVVNGFERELKDRLLAMTAHASIEGVDGDLADPGDLIEVAVKNARVTAAAPYVSGQALLVFEMQLSGAELRGVDPQLESTVSGIDGVMQTGALTDLTGGDFNIVLGVELADALQVDVGDKVTVVLAEGRVTPAGIMPRTKRFTVSGIYRVGMYEFDRRLAFINIADAQRLYRKRDSVSGVRLNVTDIYEAPDIVREVALDNGELVLVSDWTRQHVNFFRSIQITKSILFVILMMVIAVAAFNIVSTLVMVVREKTSEIAILRSMGASSKSVLWIFVAEGTLIGLVGTGLGVIFGTLIAVNIGVMVNWLESLLQISFVAPDVYFISELPSQVQADDVIRIALVAFVLAIVATIYPALRAASTNPASALRHD
jgi:lipoprotein-releasing system permease protein